MNGCINQLINQSPSEVVDHYSGSDTTQDLLSFLKEVFPHDETAAEALKPEQALDRFMSYGIHSVEDILSDHLVNDAALESEIGLSKEGVKEYHANVKKAREARAGEGMTHM